VGTASSLHANWMVDELERLEASAKSEMGEHFAHGDTSREAGGSRSPSATATAPPPPTDSAPPVAAAPAAISGSGLGAAPSACKAVPPVPAASMAESPARLRKERTFFRPFAHYICNDGDVIIANFIGRNLF